MLSLHYNNHNRKFEMIEEFRVKIKTKLRLNSKLILNASEYC